MSPTGPKPTLLDRSRDGRKQPPLGWEGAKFPLSKLDLTRLAGLDRRSNKQQHQQGGFLGSPRPLKGAASLASPPSYGHHHLTGSMRIVSKSKKGWSWLSISFKEGKCRKSAKPRKGELAPELVKAIWGAQDALDTYRNMDSHRISLDPDLELKKIHSRKPRQRSPRVKPAESLMDILLQNWTYFEHSHGELDVVEKHVHAKYCQNEFGHFLLSGERQIHGQFYVMLHLLVSELRQLMIKLRSQILPTYYQELPAWKSPVLDEAPEFETPPMPAMPQLYPIEGLVPVPSEEDESIPDDLPAPVFKPPTPRKYPSLLLPEPLKIPPLKLPTMPAFTEDESTVDYNSYKEEPLPMFVPPREEPPPVWIEPHLAEFPAEPVYFVPETIPSPVLLLIPQFQLPLLDPRPCEKAYYQLEKDQKGVCDGLCSKHGHKHHFVPGQVRREPCFAKPPPLLPLPPPPFPGAETINGDIEGLQKLALTGQTEDGGWPHQQLFAKSIEIGIPLMHEPLFEAPQEEPIPPFEPPFLKEEPTYVQLPFPTLPPWKEPNPPPPVGWLAGQRPVFLIDCGIVMRGERMAAVQKCLSDLFSPGGQVEVAATHFDVIMYSFDAWSYGEIENSYIYKQASTSRFSRPLEPMRVKSPETLEGALNWLSRWQAAGTSNLWKALTLAISRTLTDCIYLFSEGKADKPVLILESLKQQVQMQGYSIPIYTVGIRTSKPKTRFLKRLSAVTGGDFLEYDFRSARKQVEAGEPDEELQDMLWAQDMIEREQRRNAEAGRREDIKEIINRVEKLYEPERLSPRVQAYKKKVEEQDLLYQTQIQVIRKENAENDLKARQLYERIVAEVKERNRHNLARAKADWEQEVEKFRYENKSMVENFLKWRQQVEEAKQQNERTVKEAKSQFSKDLKAVEERNDATMERAKDKYTAEVERIRKLNQDIVEDVARRQHEEDEKVAAINKASRNEYEAAVAAVKESNAALLKRTRELFEEQTEWVKMQNVRIMQEAKANFAKHCEEVKAENARKKEALAQRLEDIKRRREEAIATHKLDVARTISEHEEKMKAYTAMNLENETRARTVWEKTCRDIDKENTAVAQKAMQDFEAEQIFVQEENIKLAERRLALKRRIAEVVRYNDEFVKKKKVEWKEACAKVEDDYNKEVARAKELHQKLVEDVKLRNAEKIQASLVEHKAKVAAVESYNETVRPYVEASNAVRMEIRRIEAFLQCIADSILPRDRHILEKDPSRSQLDKDLDLLAVSEVTLNTDMLIEALRSAYGKNWKTDKRGGKERSSSKMGSLSDETSSLSGLIPISPVRVAAHSCLTDRNIVEP